jgi:hypothetical protein
MSIQSPSSPFSFDQDLLLCSKHSTHFDLFPRLASAAVLLMIFALSLAGCGAGGYAGGGIEAMSLASLTLDGGQSYKLSAAASGAVTITYSLSGPACTGTACGSLSNTTGTTVTYTAPTGVTAQMHVTLLAAVTGTSSSTTTAITVNPDPAIVGTPPPGIVGVAYSTTLVPNGGTAPVTMSISGGSLPPGLSFNATTGVLSGTPTSIGTFNFATQIVDSSIIPLTVTGNLSITISTPSGLPLTLAGMPPAGTVGTAYVTTFSAAGGTAPYTFSVASGTLPAGLALSSTGVLSGTPTAAGVSVFSIRAQDSTGATAMGTFSITVNPSNALSLTLSSLPNGMVGTPYSSTIGVSGGTSPYACTITSGTLPAGLTLTGCLVSGTPTVAGTSNLTVKATDSSNPQQTTTGPVALTITSAALSLTLSSLPNGMVGTPYSSTIGVSGGTSPYACTITSGTLPAGLTLTGCLVSGTPTVAGTSNLTVKATDSSNPQQTTTGPVAITITSAALSLTLSSLPNGMVGTPYSSTIGVSGGTSPYACTITSGTLPAGLTLTGCLVSGTPTVAGTSNLTVKATDSSNPQQTTTGPVALTITSAALSLTLSSLPNGMVGTPYSSTIGVSGGTSPYACTITSGTLPAGLTLTGCLVSGTPTVAGTSNLTVKATDSSNPQQTTTGPVALTITPAAAVLNLSSPPAGTINVAYSGLVGVGGGTAPYTCMLVSGTLQVGLSLNGCNITGTPTVSGSSTIQVKATDSSSPAATTTGPVTVVINPATTTLTIASPPPATVDTPYTGVIPVGGGTSPYTCNVTSGSLPAGLTLTGCTLTGTPTSTGSTTVIVTATDSGNPVDTTSGPITITVNALAPLTLTGSLPNPTLSVPYTQTLQAQGGLAPYTYAITAGALPAGLTLSSGGVISGTPTVVGASSFTVTATDSQTTPHTASLPLVLVVLYPSTTTDAELTGPYAYLFQGYDDVVAGVLAYQTATVASFTADGKGGVTGGEMDANHQTSTPTGATVATSSFLGTYTLGPDSRGFLTLTVLNADGTTGATTTYAIAVKAPVSPATVATQGSLIESDENQLVGTKGSGTLLAQTASAYAAGLSSSFAFGLSGDTPCLPSCTIGILAGPVAAVGQFTTDGAGAIHSGTSDLNIATSNIANTGLGGTYGTADQNGRLQLSMTTAGTTGDAYPTDYAVYLVNSTQAFIMSTDKHSAYILLAGTATQQSQPTFSDASMNGPFIGYENSASNPGLLGVTLQNVLNFSTATIFRGMGTGNGNCSITNVDTGGATSLLSNVSGLVGGLSGLTGILGSYTQTGSTTCAVTSNGRGVLQYPVATVLGVPTGTPPAPRVFYMTSPNAGYFLETSYAALGRLEAQTGAPFNETTTFTGTYVYGSTPASSLASIDASGTITSNGAGEANATLDENVGVGTINVIELGQTGMQPYTAPNATTGRFTLGTAGTIVLYAITPNRFVLLDTNPVTTSPSVAVLY